MAVIGNVSPTGVWKSDFPLCFDYVSLLRFWASYGVGDSPKTEMLDFLLIPQSVKPWTLKPLVCVKKLSMTVFAPGFVEQSYWLLHPGYVHTRTIRKLRSFHHQPQVESW